MFSLNFTIIIYPNDTVQVSTKNKKQPFYTKGDLDSFFSIIRILLKDYVKEKNFVEKFKIKQWSKTGTYPGKLSILTCNYCGSKDLWLNIQDKNQYCLDCGNRKPVKLSALCPLCENELIYLEYAALYCGRCNKSYYLRKDKIILRFSPIE
ncbi:hypothetical protein CEE45_01450 [Candidatus Heimdallarchaeota archaeon B3_Heim]|nr:MAG: hypothetical protein CEE45_01450 [Candidatus Heimdallarchaeota archaeon B3_Heim]